MRTFEGRHAKARVRCLAFLPDGSGLVAGGNNGVLRLWDLATGQPRWSRQISVGINDLDVLIDGSGGLAVLSFGVVGAWSMADGSVIGRYEPPYPASLRLDLDGGGVRVALAVGCISPRRDQPGRVLVRDRSLAQSHATFELSCGALSVAFDPDSGQVAVGTACEGIIFWNHAAQPRPEPFASIQSRKTRPGEGYEDVAGHRRIATDAGVRHIRYSADGRTLIAAVGRSILVVDAATGRRVATCRGHSANVTSVDLSADGMRIASGARDESVRLWNAATGDPVACYDREVGPVECVRFAPDGMTLAAGGRTGIVLWDVEPS